MSIAQLKNVKKSYRSGFALRRTEVLHGIDFEIEEGEVFAYLGHNGAGKSTTVKALLGLIRADEGEIRVLGCRAGDRRALRRMGYLPENPYFYDHLTGREFVQLAAQLCGLDRGSTRRRVGEVLELCGMQLAADNRLRSYSKGMLQRIGLAQALVHEPELLVLDEPMGGLDPVGRAQIRQIIANLSAENRTIFLCSHILADVELLADRAAILSQGHLKRIVDLHELRVEGRRMEVHCRGLREEDVQRLRSEGHDVEIGGEAHSVFVDDESRVADVIGRIHAADARLLSVQPVRRTLEEIFLSEVGAAATSSDSVVVSMVEAVSRTGSHEHPTEEVSTR